MRLIGHPNLESRSVSEMFANSQSTSKPKVLVVEDDKTLREALRYNLVAEGYVVVVAEDGGDGRLFGCS